MKRLTKKVISKIAPEGSLRRAYVKKITKPHQPSTLDYLNWIDHYEKNLLKADRSTLKDADVLISVVVPSYNTPDKYLKPLIESFINQTYLNWQLVLVDASDNKTRSDAIKQAAGIDERIKYKRLSSNLGIALNTNEGISIADGEYVGFTDHDDTLSPFALQEVVKVIKLYPETDLIYSDEDKLSDDGKTRQLPLFKPDWSPDLLLGVNYITHFVVARKKIISEIKGLRKGFDGAQDFDFLLRFTEKTDKIKHIPKILYHWRLAEGSTAKNVGEKNYADDAGQRALKDAVKRRGMKADVIEIKDRPTNYRLKYSIPNNQPLVSIIIPFKDKADLLKQCVGSILDKSTYKNFEVILLSNNSLEKETHYYLDEVRDNGKCRVIEWNKPFNYSAINNFGAKKAKGDYLVLLNNDTEVITPDWLEELIGVASQPGVGAVGPMLFYPDETIQHAGVVLGMNTMAGHVFRRLVPGQWTDFGLPDWPRNYLAVTGACLVIERKKYLKMGGLDEEFTIAGNDVALGIKLHESGYRNVYWPFARLVHYENVSVGSYNNVPQRDYDHSLDYYKPYLNWGDPYFNPNLSLMSEQISLREK
jgi:GT2 family glycosyltransferase